MAAVAVAGGGGGTRVGGASAGGAGTAAGAGAGGGGGLSRAGTSALTGIADPPSPSKPGSMEDAIKLWLKIGNIEKLQVRKYLVSFIQLRVYVFTTIQTLIDDYSKLSLMVMGGT